ncbi:MULTISPECIES: hypothetical protein [unclassified Halomonas]|uniref:hypothetical protein n=1 Tax=unclassified Halomonas TaxID=2609666 RepID=UPI0004B3150F|nr:hypothetical protein [Halomonas sp. 23_GOM-1509m]NAO94892.1 hypothetical protein [Halomonas sp. MG34]QGQ71859.1 hypothetical protein FDY98_20615 [Halomonas sp. PA16-9]
MHQAHEPELLSENGNHAMLEGYNCSIRRRNAATLVYQVDVSACIKWKRLLRPMAVQEVTGFYNTSDTDSI